MFRIILSLLGALDVFSKQTEESSRRPAVWEL
jgi:hypothetical protein